MMLAEHAEVLFSSNIKAMAPIGMECFHLDFISRAETGSQIVMLGSHVGLFEGTLSSETRCVPQ